MKQLPEPIYEFEPVFPYQYEQTLVTHIITFDEQPLATFGKIVPRSIVEWFIRMLNGAYNMGRSSEKINQLISIDIGT